MASGDGLFRFHPYQSTPTVADYATHDNRNQHPVLDFDDATDEHAVFKDFFARNYASGGVTVYVHYSMETATADDVVWNVAFERIGDEGLDVDADGFAAAQTVTDTVPGTCGHVGVAAITFTHGAQMDSVAVGELYRLKVTRDADNGSDTATGDAELHGVEGKET